MIRLRPSLLIMILLYLAYDKAEARNFTPASQFEEAFATSLVLSDSNMITSVLLTSIQTAIYLKMKITLTMV